MSSNKKPAASIEFLLEEYGLPHYRWQAVLHLIRAGNKENIPELDDLNAAMEYLKRDIACVQKSRRSSQQHLPGSRPSRPSRSRQLPPKANSVPTSAPAAEEAHQA